MPSDITAGITFTNNQQNINAAQLNAIVGGASLNPSFVSTKPSSTGMAATDTVLMYSQGGLNLQQVSYSVLSSQILGVTQNGALNAIQNGDMSCNQWAMGPAGTQSGASFKTIDRWYFVRGGTATLRPTVTQGNVGGTGTLISPNPPFYNYCKVVPSTTQGSLAAGDFAVMQHTLESSNVLQLLNQPMSLSFVYNTNAAGKYYVSFRDSVLGFSYITPFTASGDSAWHLATFPNIVAPTASGNWGLGSYGSLGMNFAICLGTGSTYQSSTFNAWQAGNFIGGSDQFNFFNTSSNYFQISQVCLNTGVTASPFPSIPFPINLAQCQRSYSQSYNYGVVPGTASANAYASLTTITVSSAVGYVPFPVPMRAVPTITLYNASTGATGTVWDVSAGASIGSSPAASGLGTSGFSGVTFTSGGTAGHMIQEAFTADTGI